MKPENVEMPNRFELLQWASQHPSGLEEGLFAGSQCSFHAWINALHTDIADEDTSARRARVETAYRLHILIDGMFEAVRAYRMNAR